MVFSDARPKTAMGCLAPSPCETKVEIPGVMIDNEPGVALKDLLVGGTVVTATLDPASKIEQIWLTDTMDDSSSRGPGRFYAHIKPQITAPGHNIFSVANGSGAEGVSFSGTSMSGPAVAGVLIVDYWIVRKTRLDLRSLYVRGGSYEYQRGWNVSAVVATLVGAGVALAGAFWEPMRPIYNWSWFVGFGLAGALYWALMRGKGPAQP